MNPLDLLKMANNPSQMIEMLLKQLPPTQQQVFKLLMQQNTSPQQAILNAAKSGQLNQQQLQQARNVYNNMKQFGVKVEIPERLWDEASQIVNEASASTIKHDYKRF